MVSKYAGGTEENFHTLFQQARDNAPSIIFFDEIDAISSKRSEESGMIEKNVVSTLLTEMDGIDRFG